MTVAVSLGLPSSPDLLEDHNVFTVTTVTIEVGISQTDGQVNEPGVIYRCSGEIIKTGTRREVL